MINPWHLTKHYFWPKCRDCGRDLLKRNEYNLCAFCGVLRLSRAMDKHEQEIKSKRRKK